MICQNCHRNEANVHMTTTINGHTEEQHLCSECAEKSGVLKESFAMNSLFPSDRMSRMFSPANWFGNNLFGLPFGNSMNERLLGDSCPSCDMTLNQFGETGLLGCPDCYDTYRDEVSDIVERQQGTDQHLSINGRDDTIETAADEVETEGETETATSGDDNRLNELKQRLQTALDEEDYLECAKLRDEIRKLEEE